MGFSAASKPKRSQAVVCEHLPDGSTLLFDTRSLTSIAVTKSAAMVWEVCDGTRDVDGLVSILTEVYEAPREVVTADVLRLLEDLDGRGLLEIA